MTLVGYLLYVVVRWTKFLGDLLHRVSRFLCAFLPVLFPPSKFMAMSKNVYDTGYRDTPTLPEPTLWEYELTNKEVEFLGQYNLQSGRLLVLGTGMGRESIGMARRGVTVVGVDLNHDALGRAKRASKSLGVRAHFHQANFLELPYAPASFDFVLLSSNMYSSIPGQAWRQAWLGEVGRVLKPHGVMMLSFAREFSPASRVQIFRSRLTRMLAKLPGANRSYQHGDEAWDGYFFHWFQDDGEIRGELLSAGVEILELDWSRGCAIITYPPRLQQMPQLQRREELVSIESLTHRERAREEIY